MQATTEIGCPGEIGCSGPGAVPDATPQRWRPQYHYAPRRHWLSDPNGLVWHAGEWHLFYQYNPHGDQWGHMSWGHAVSADLIHWTELPVAIAEDARHMIFSGSAIVAPDPADPTGPAAIAAFYTGAERGEGGRQVQCLAISHDAGRTFAAFPGNPVVDEGRSDFRDPKVFWHAPSGAYVMVAVLADLSMARLYRSTDLVRWTAAGEIGPFALPGAVWECPDLIELSIAGEDESAWLFKVDLLHTDPDVRGSGAVAIAGRFDGYAFTPFAQAGGAPAWQWVDHGRDFYAAVGWNGAPPGDARRIWIGWLGNHRYQARLPDTGWRGAMTLPRALDWVRDGDALRLRQRPVAEADALCGADVPCDDLALSAGAGVTVAADLPRALRLRFGVQVAAGGRLTLSLAAPGGSAVDLIFTRDAIELDRSRCGTVPDDAADFHVPMRLSMPAPMAHAVDLWIDDHAIELFAADGTAVLTAMTFLSPGPLSLTWRADDAGGTVTAATWTPVARAIAERGDGA